MANQGTVPAAGEETVLYSGQPALIPSIGILGLTIITLGLFALYRLVATSSTKYRITNQRVVIDSGLFSKRLEQTDLYRIVDYSVERPFGQRLMGTGNLVLRTTDHNAPVLRIDHLKGDVVDLYEKLRRATEAERTRRGVRMLDVE